MVVVQVCLDFVEFVLGLTLVGRLRADPDFRIVAFALVFGGAGVALPKAYPLGHPTWFSLAAQVAAVAVLGALSRPESMVRWGGRGRRRWI